MNDIVLEINHLGHQYGDNHVLYDINLKVQRGQFVALVGQSGCGKSTLLKAILGILRPINGSILVDGKPIIGPSRDVGVVLQQYPLYTSKTCIDNVAAGLTWDQHTLSYRLLRPFKYLKDRKEHYRISKDMLEKVHLDPIQHYKYPEGLSGGQQQRVAIAQALVMKPKILLLDEPFGALDESTRESAQRMLQEMYQINIEAIRQGGVPPFTVIIVTHELNEALIVSDRLIGLSRGWSYSSPCLEEETGLKRNCELKEGAKMGATKVYDRATHVFKPDDVKDMQMYIDQKHEIRDNVLSKDANVDPFKFINFWEQVKNGEATGVFDPSLKEHYGSRNI